MEFFRLHITPDASDLRSVVGIIDDWPFVRVADIACIDTIVGGYVAVTWPIRLIFAAPQSFSTVSVVFSPSRFTINRAAGLPAFSIPSLQLRLQLIIFLRQPVTLGFCLFVVLKGYLKAGFGATLFFDQLLPPTFYGLNVRLCTPGFPGSIIGKEAVVLWK